jgi:gas vesicle protein GvpN
MARLPTDEITSVIRPITQPDFVETEYIKGITERSLSYIKVGYAVHLRGGSGTGKTSIAMHIANKLGRPVMLIHGDEEFNTSDLIGGKYGFRMRRVVDNFIQSVLKTEEDMVQRWVDSRLTVACRFGYTLIYDEFTRSRPEANNVLLSILQERIMDLPVIRGGEESYIKVHPQFTALFTSNPEEYAGVYRSQDALRDRMITIDLDYFDKETEVLITQSKSGLSRMDSEKIVSIVRALRESGECECAPTVRGCIKIARSIQIMNLPLDCRNETFCQVCSEVLASETSRVGNLTGQKQVKDIIRELVNTYC